MFGPRGRKLRYEELNQLFSSPNNIRVIKSMRMRHVARMDGMRNTKFQSENVKERDHFGDLGVDERKY
jgi:hypothetical protein